MTLSRPTVFPTWAAQNRVDPISGQNNVTTPPTEKQQYGWALAEEPARNWFNWLGRYTDLWIQFLAQQESQSIVTDDNSGETTMFDVVNGGMAILNIVDSMNAVKFYQGMVYIPAGYSSGTLNFIDTSSSNLTISALSVTGAVTVTGGGGTGPYIFYAQMKTVP